MTTTSHGTAPYGTGQNTSATASGGKKALSVVLDLIIAGIVPVVLASVAEILFMMSGDARPGLIYWLLYGLAALLFLLIFGVILLRRAKAGTSPGMATMGIRTIKDHSGAKRTIDTRRSSSAPSAQPVASAQSAPSASEFGHPQFTPHSAGQAPGAAAMSAPSTGSAPQTGGVHQGYPSSQGYPANQVYLANQVYPNSEDHQANQTYPASQPDASHQGYAPGQSYPPSQGHTPAPAAPHIVPGSQAPVSAQPAPTSAPSAPTSAQPAPSSAQSAPRSAQSAAGTAQEQPTELIAPSTQAEFGTAAGTGVEVHEAESYQQDDPFYTSGAYQSNYEPATQPVEITDSADSAPGAGSAPDAENAPASERADDAEAASGPEAESAVGAQERAAGRVSALAGASTAPAEDISDPVASERVEQPVDLEPTTGAEAEPVADEPAAPVVDDSAAPEADEPAAPLADEPAEPAASADAVPAHTMDAPTDMLPADDDAEETRLLTPVIPAAEPAAPNEPSAAFHLVFDDGTRYGVSEAALVGRGPTAVGAEETIAVTDAEKSISKTHAKIEIGEHGIVVTDLGSTNGTTVTDPDGTVYPVVAHQATIIPEGWSLQLGDRHVTVERPA